MDEETKHLIELRNVLVHRRRLLEKRQKIQGDATPPDVAMDLDRTDDEIELVEAKLRKKEIDPEVWAATGERATWDALSLRLKRMERDVRNALAGILEEIAGDREEAWQWRNKQERARTRGQWRTQIAIGMLFFVQLAELGVLLYLVYRLVGL